MSAEKASVMVQPAIVRDMELYHDLHVAGQDRCCQVGGTCRRGYGELCCEYENRGFASSHKRCHAQRRRRVILLVASISTLLLLLIAASLCFLHMTGRIDVVETTMNFLGKRATGDTTGNDNGTFVDRKYYLIIIFVGLFLLLILAIMLSAWCCKGAFENPLCCPCYLCACCGGLACIECIGCGLCAEGLEQM